MPAMTERAVPYMAREKRVSSVGDTTMVLSFFSILTTEAKVLFTLPFGPSTDTVVPLMSILTLSGMGTGCLPILLMVVCSLPDGADEFSAEFVAAGVLVLHETLGGGNDRDAQAVEDAGNLGVAGIEAATRGGRALEAGDDRGAVDIFHGDDDGLVAALVGAGGDVTDVAFALEDVRQALLELGVRGNAHGETGLRRIAEVGQKITDWVCHGWMFWMLPVGSYPTSGGKVFTRRTW